MARAVAVVEEVFACGVVDGDDGEFEFAGFFECAEANDAGSGFFHTGDDAVGLFGSGGVQLGNEVGAVVEGDDGFMVECGVDVLVVGFAVFAADCEDGYAEILD